MISIFYITTQEGTYAAHTRLIYRHGQSLPFCYQLMYFDLPGYDLVEMWPEETRYLVGSDPDVENWYSGPSAATEELARAACITWLEDMLAVYETWPHSSEGPYIPS